MNVYVAPHQSLSEFQGSYQTMECAPHSFRHRCSLLAVSRLVKCSNINSINDEMSAYYWV